MPHTDGLEPAVPLASAAERTMFDDFRVYSDDELAPDGYPFVWRQIPGCPNGFGIKDSVRNRAGDRCIRCGHPYRKGEHGRGEWSPCDERCTHPYFDIEIDEAKESGVQSAMWRILTVHHANGVKADLRWWNLLALCQRCHLTIQGRVVWERAFIFEHSEWLKPYAAGWYAEKYLGEPITMAEAIARQDELLGLERLA